jgi:hypothetical protein
MKLLSTYFSDDQMRTAWVFYKGEEFMVEVLDSITHKEQKYFFNSEQEAEDFAEEWVL